MVEKPNVNKFPDFLDSHGLDKSEKQTLIVRQLFSLDFTSSLQFFAESFPEFFFLVPKNV